MCLATSLYRVVLTPGTVLKNHFIFAHAILPPVRWWNSHRTHKKTKTQEQISSLVKQLNPFLWDSESPRASSNS